MSIDRDFRTILEEVPVEVKTALPGKIGVSRTAVAFRVRSVFDIPSKWLMSDVVSAHMRNPLSTDQATHALPLPELQEPSLQALTRHMHYLCRGGDRCRAGLHSHISRAEILVDICTALRCGSLSLAGYTTFNGPEWVGEARRGAPLKDPARTP